ncbi:hypothetical protein J7K24_02265 [bacterium]|nr:hypothetical protein [bacterium]
MPEEFSREQIILGIIIVALLAISFFLIKSMLPELNINPSPPEESPPSIIEEPVYEVKIGDVKFRIKEVKDRGNKLSAVDAYSWRPSDLITTEKFIEVTIEVQNIGTKDIKGGWDMKNIFDKEGREFAPYPEALPWVSPDSDCGAILKPGFSPTLCTKIYEVAKISSGLRVQVNVRNVGSDYLDLGI